MREPLAVRDPRHRVMRIWLWSIAALIFAMVLVGGATRLTESGLSITEWQPVTGTLPPLSDAAWTAAFEKYKAIPQYQQVNRGMSLAEFKTIFWWEWAHRLLGRLIGAAFLLPFLWFLWRGWVEPGLRGRLWLIFGLGALQGAVGWWMVASGLAERVEVSQYRLAFHLTLACLIYVAVLGTAERLSGGAPVAVNTRLRATAAGLVVLVLAQIYLGALVAGLRAGLVYNTWPTIDGALVHGPVPAPHDGLHDLGRRGAALARRPAVAPEGPAHRRAPARGDAAGGAWDLDADPAGADRARACPSGDGDDRAGARHSARGTSWRGRVSEQKVYRIIG
jgi:heme A synthase